jgi:uncharacterized protein
MNEPELIRSLLAEVKTIAVVGLSSNPERPSYGVSRFMQRQGYRIVPVNPEVASVLGETAYPTLELACERCAAEGTPIDLVNVFRAPVFVPEVVKEAMRLRLPALWLQEGVVHPEAAEWAEHAGIRVVMDRCLLKDYLASGPRPAVS